MENNDGEVFWACTKACYLAIQRSKASSRVPWDKDGPNGPTDPVNSETILLEWLLRQPTTTAITAVVTVAKAPQRHSTPTRSQACLKQKESRLKELLNRLETRLEELNEPIRLHGISCTQKLALACWQQMKAASKT
ncbi:unnamed protein product [Cylindrotheca closterium]|uniref:Uncharacterized protein n=1 Tax=Cylindrotheca closterium TaxID=2856 RepID=A0AAD2FV76_9STRA|nr:unnamed protein product [Cylindrotheca closterium]